MEPETTPTAEATDAVRAFFERYARAFEAFDAEFIAAGFVTPCLFVRDGHTEAAATPEAIAASVGHLLDLHRAWDVQTIRPDAVAVLEAGPAHVVARVDWTLGRSRSRLTWAYPTTYTLVPSDGGWRIAAAVTHDAPF